MKIAHYLQRIRFSDGGTARAVLDLCELLASAGQEVTLLTTDAVDAPAEWKQGRRPGLPQVVEVPGPLRPLELLGGPTVREFKSRLRGHDVLHLHGAWTVSNLQLWRAARSLGIPHVVTPHGMLDDWCMQQSTLKKRIFLAAAGRRMLAQAAFAHFSAQAELDQSMKHIPGGRGVVVPNLLSLQPYTRGIGPEAAREHFAAFASGRPTLLFLSRIHPKKGVERLIDAAKILRDRGVEASVLIAGGCDGDYIQSLRQRVESANLTDRVWFLGPVMGDLKLSLYTAADLMVIPTSQENFGFVFFEALASGLPVVTTYGVDTWPELRGSGGAVIVEPEPALLADAVAGLLADPGARAEMGRRGRAWVFEHLDPQRIVEQFIAHYAAAAGASRADAPIAVGAAGANA